MALTKRQSNKPRLWVIPWRGLFTSWLPTDLVSSQPSCMKNLQWRAQTVIWTFHIEFDVNNYFPSVLWSFYFGIMVVNEKSDCYSFVGFFLLSLKAFYNFLLVLSVLRVHQNVTRGGSIISVLFCLIFYGPKMITCSCLKQSQAWKMRPP